jgi:hypothetical protein
MVTAHSQWIPVENVHYATPSCRKRAEKEKKWSNCQETVDYKSLRKGDIVYTTHP